MSMSGFGGYSYTSTNISERHRYENDTIPDLREPETGKWRIEITFKNPQHQLAQHDGDSIHDVIKWGEGAAPDPDDIAKINIYRI